MTKRNGATKTEILSHEVSPGLWAIDRSHGGTRRYECDECGDMVEPGTSCWETGLAHSTHR